ncbi:MAG: hypothetical protein QOJ57_2311, partial [Thermoleophilaceae bacterium]|nr:hypothetical protein [Thermoleophilaceae bacterium]
MRRRLTTLAACFVLAAVPLALAGCGNKAPGIPRSDASEMITVLKQIQVESDDPQRCDELSASIRQLAAKVRALPSNVDSDVRDTLTNGVRNLAESARAQCDQAQTTTTTTPTATTGTVPPPTTETLPPPTTETTPPPTTETTPPPTTPPVPTTPGTGGTGPGENGGGAGNGGNGKRQGQGGRFGNGGSAGYGYGRGGSGNGQGGD